MKGKSVTFRFYEELNDFLPAIKKKEAFTHPFIGKISVKEAIEEIGVPHTQIDLILVDGQSVDFGYLLQDGDHISVYPVFESLDISPIVHLRPKPLRESKFIVDAHLGKLAKYLRILGFDTLFDNHYPDEDIVKISLAEHRIILTRDKGLLKDIRIQHGYWIREIEPKKQIQEIIDRFQLQSQFAPFTRCLECNGDIAPASFEDVKDRLPAENKEDFRNISQCVSCGKVYWEGSHYQRMEEFIHSLIKSD